jgi:hypothetical protein
MINENADEIMRNEILRAARERGIDPDLVKKEDIKVSRSNEKIRIKWQDIEIEVPAPSQEVVDSWFKQNGQVLTGAFIALISVVLARSQVGWACTHAHPFMDGSGT